MSNILVATVGALPFSGTDYNNNLDKIENALLDLGPYIISGLVPSAGAGLSVSVTSGVASIGGRVTVGSSFSIGGLTPSAVNHLYLLQNGTGTANTTGTAPANSVKLGTATTDATTVTSVDTTRAGGRQTKVDMTTIVTTADANAFTAIQTFTLNDAVATVSRPLVLRHSNSGGVGPAGLGVGLDLQVETATEALFNTAARIDARATVVTAGAMTGALDLSVPNAGTMVTPATLTPTELTLTVDDASGSAVSRPLILRHSNSGGAGSAGIGTGLRFDIETGTNGTFNEAARIDAVTTAVTAGAVSAVLDFSAPNAGAMVKMLRLAAASVEITDAVNVKVGTTTGTKWGTATTEKQSWWNATPVVQQILATGAGATVDNVITLLQTLGLCRQS